MKLATERINMEDLNETLYRWTHRINMHYDDKHGVYVRIWMCAAIISNVLHKHKNV